MAKKASAKKSATAKKPASAKKPLAKKTVTKPSGKWDKNDPRGKRPSPSVSASQTDVGTEMLGNDGNLYVVRANKNGIHQWKKV